MYIRDLKNTHRVRVQLCAGRGAASRCPALLDTSKHTQRVRAQGGQQACSACCVPASAAAHRLLASSLLQLLTACPSSPLAARQAT